MIYDTYILVNGKGTHTAEFKPCTSTTSVDLK